jgi:hypothetical protein
MRLQMCLGDDKFAERMAAHAKEHPREISRIQRARKSLAQYERAAGDRDSAIRAAYVSGTYHLENDR